MDELNSEEQAQFKQMEQQEAADKVAIEEEKQAPVEEKTEIEQPEEKVKNVPLNALQEERVRRQAAEEKFRQSELNQARLDERIKAINERLAPKEAPKEFPDPEKDAMGALKATAEEMKEFRRDREQRENQERQRIFAQQVISQASAKEAEFMKDNPDYGEAGNFLMKSRFDELIALGQDPFTANNVVYQEKLHLAAQALNAGKNPAEVAYALAKSRGYAKSTSVQKAQPDTDTEKLARIAEGQKANLSLGNVNTTPGKPQLDGKAIASMSDEDFSKFLEKLPVKERSKYLGA